MTADRLLGRLALVLALAPAALAASACVDPSPPAADAGRSLGPKPGVHGEARVGSAPSGLVATATRATSTGTPARGALVAPSSSSPRGAPLDCARDVKWTQLTRCQHDGVLYATGFVAGVQDIGLARSAAADRARRALVPAAKAPVLEDSEVVDFVRCPGASHALARVKLPADAGAVPACDLGALASKSPLDPSCPEWVRATAWRSEGTVSGVGAAKLRNVALADAAAAARARAELQRLVREARTPGSAAGEGATDPHGHEAGAATSAEGHAYSEIGRERAVCEGVTYVKIVARGTGGDPCADHP